MKSSEQNEIEKTASVTALSRKFAVLSLNSSHFGLWQGVTGRKVGRGRCTCVGQGYYDSDLLVLLGLVITITYKCHI